MFFDPSFLLSYFSLLLPSLSLTSFSLTSFSLSHFLLSLLLPSLSLHQYTQQVFFDIHCTYCGNTGRDGKSAIKNLFIEVNGLHQDLLCEHVSNSEKKCFANALGSKDELGAHWCEITKLRFIQWQKILTIAIEEVSCPHRGKPHTTKTHALNWNILVEAGKEINRDSVSIGERTRNRRLLNVVIKSSWKSYQRG